MATEHTQHHVLSTGRTTSIRPVKGRRTLAARCSPYFFLLPALLPYTVFVIYPIFASLRLSLYNWDGMSAHRQFVGLQNFVQTLRHDPVFWLAVGNNIKWTVFSLIVPILFGFMFAVYFGRAKPGFGAYRAIIYFPAILSSAVVAQLFRWLYDPSFGLINVALQKVSNGSQFFDWQGIPDNTIFYVAIAGSWGYCGFCMLLFINGIRAIPEELYEAASIDGASKLEAMRYITIPLLRNTSNVIITSTVVFSFQVFDYIVLMTNGGPGHSTSVLATWAYNQFFNYYSVGKGTAIAIMLGMLVLTPAIVSQRLAARASDF